LKAEQDQQLFQKGLIRWRALSGAERFVCVVMSLAPLCWMFGWSYAPLTLTIGIFVYQLGRYGNLGLKRPSLPVIALLVFTAYSTVLYKFNVPDGGPAGLIGPMQLWGTAGLLLWCVQSHRIRVRVPVVAWGFSIIVLEAVCYWLFAHFVLGETSFTPIRTIMATFLDKGETYSSAKLGSVGNFLVPYTSEVKGFGGLVRYAFFFPHPTTASFVFSFAVLVALDLKNRTWSRCVIGAAIFLILICQSRNLWLSLTIVVLIRWLMVTGRTKGIAFLMAFFAAASFAVLSVPAITNSLADKIETTTEDASNLRKSSTEDRNKIYSRTWETIVEEMPVIGHSLPGPEVTPGYEFARIGTESFILGTLLYKSGFLGTGMFLTFLVPYLSWLYQTRRDRPLCSFLMLLLMGLACTVTEFLSTEALTLTLCTIMTTSDSIPSSNQRMQNR
jgi:hypothetical protein